MCGALELVALTDERAGQTGAVTDVRHSWQCKGPRTIRVAEWHFEDVANRQSNVVARRSGRLVVWWCGAAGFTGIVGRLWGAWLGVADLVTFGRLGRRRSVVVAVRVWFLGWA